MRCMTYDMYGMYDMTGGVSVVRSLGGGGWDIGPLCPEHRVCALPSPPCCVASCCSRASVKKELFSRCCRRSPAFISCAVPRSCSTRVCMYARCMHARLGALLLPVSGSQDFLYGGSRLFCRLASLAVSRAGVAGSSFWFVPWPYIPCAGCCPINHDPPPPCKKKKKKERSGPMGRRRGPRVPHRVHREEAGQSLPGGRVQLHRKAWHAYRVTTSHIA